MSQTEHSANVFVSFCLESFFLHRQGALQVWKGYWHSQFSRLGIGLKKRVLTLSYFYHFPFLYFCCKFCFVSSFTTQAKENLTSVFWPSSRPTSTRVAHWSPEGQVHPKRKISSSSCLSPRRSLWKTRCQFLPSCSPWQRPSSRELRLRCDLWRS